MTKVPPAERMLSIPPGYVCHVHGDPMAGPDLALPVVGIAYDNVRAGWKAVVLDHEGMAVFAEGAVGPVKERQAGRR